MDQIQHKHVQVGDLKLHVAEIGTGEKLVLFLQGFPEIWYSWRHQMVAVANAGYRAIAIDYRGYGLSDQPPQPQNTTLIDFSDDVKGILNSLSINKEIMDLVAPSTPLPPWLSEEDFSTYASLYEKFGFSTALQVPYRSMDQYIDIQDPQVRTPSLLIMGEKEYVLKFPGMEDNIRSGAIKKFVPNLEIVFMPEGTHFVQEQVPEEVNQHIISFINKHSIQ